MSQNNIEQKLGYDKIGVVYNSSKSFVQKTADKVLLGAITIDTLLGNPSIAYAQEVSKNTYTSWNMMYDMFITFGFLSITCGMAEEDRKRRMGYSVCTMMCGIFSTIAAVFK